jgi:hypothetical protein
MNFKTMNVKQLNQIEHLAKKLLLTLDELELVDENLNQDLTVLAIETHNEQKLRLMLDTAQRFQETANKLNIWENEGGHTARAVE